MSNINVVIEINRILEINETYDAPKKIMDILYDKQKRERVFGEFLKVFDYDVSYDWFNKYFEFEHADRKVKKQDFTPKEVSTLLAKLTGKKNDTIYDCAAGTGGLTIKKWWEICKEESIANYYPANHLFFLEDLSSRSIPFLLFNLIIRGMNAVVIHCDTLTREAYGVFLIQNVDNDFLHFSNFNVFPYTKEVEDYFNIKFIEQKYQKHIENAWQIEN